LARSTKGTGLNRLRRATSALLAELPPCVLLLTLNNRLHVRRHILLNRGARELLRRIELKLIGLRFLELGKRCCLCALKLRFTEASERIYSLRLKPTKFSWLILREVSLTELEGLTSLPGNPLPKHHVPTDHVHSLRESGDSRTSDAARNVVGSVDVAHALGSYALASKRLIVRFG